MAKKVNRLFVLIATSITNRSGKLVNKYSYSYDENTGEQTRTLTKVSEIHLDEGQLSYYISNKFIEEFDPGNDVHTEGMGKETPEKAVDKKPVVTGNKDKLKKD